MKSFTSFLIILLLILSTELSPEASPQDFVKAGILKGPGGWQVGLKFQDIVDLSTAATGDHFLISEGTLGFRESFENGTAWIIPVIGLEENKSLIFTVKNLKDKSGNELPACHFDLNSDCLSWTSIGANELGLLSQVIATGTNAFDIIDGGIQFYNRYDEGTFVYEQVTGDFDRAIKVLSQEPSSRYARAGLMVRESLDAGKPRPADPFEPSQAFSRYLGLHRNPQFTADGRNGNNNLEIVWRPYTGGIGSPNVEATELISFNENIPSQHLNQWVRIKREGSTFRLFNSEDGENWIEMASATFPTIDSNGQAVPPFPATVYLGAVYSPENGSLSASSGLRRSFEAEFSDYTRAAGASPRLSITKTGDQVELQWGGEGVLQSTESLITANWQDIGLAPNPYRFSPVNTRFFRVRK